MRMSMFARTAVSMTQGNGAKRLLIDTELHNRGGDKLYAVCIPNDTAKPEQWQLESVRTARELFISMNIDCDFLPRGVREFSAQFEQYRMLKGHLDTLKAQILRNGDKGIESLQHSRPKFGRRKNAKKKRDRQNRKEFGPIKTVKQSSFIEAVSRSLQNPNVDLIPIVSKKGLNFSIEYLLPVQLGTESVGIVYQNGESVSVLLDSYDIINKAILCDPLFNAKGFQWFRNSFNKLEIVPDHDHRGHGMVETLSSRTFHEASTPRRTPSPSTDLGDHYPSWLQSGCSLTPPPTPSIVSDESWTPSLSAANYAVEIQPVPVFVYMSTEELLCFMEQLKVDMEQNVAYYQQFIGWRPCGQK